MNFQLQESYESEHIPSKSQVHAAASGECDPSDFDHPKPSRYGKTSAGTLFYHKGKAKYLGGSHWRNLLVDFHDLLPHHNMKERAKKILDIRSQDKALKRAFKVRFNINFPFGGETKPMTVNEARVLLPSREDARRYVEIYLSTIERLYRILHIPSFHEEISAFWDDPEVVEPIWLALFFMIMAVGAHVEQLIESDEPRHVAVVDRFLEGAQGCLCSTKM